MDQQTRRDLFRATGAAGLGLAASRVMTAGEASAHPASGLQPQPIPTASQATGRQPTSLSRRWSPGVCRSSSEWSVTE